MSVRIYHYSLLNNPEAPSSHTRRMFNVVGGRGQTLCAFSSHFTCYVRMILRSESSPFLQDGITSDYNSPYVLFILHQHGQVAIIRPESFPCRTGQVRCKSCGVCCSCRPGPLVLVHVSVRHTVPNYHLI